MKLIGKTIAAVNAVVKFGAFCTVLLYVANEQTYIKHKLRELEAEVNKLKAERKG